MSENDQENSLNNWNQLNIENTRAKILQVMIQSYAKSYEATESFSSWLFGAAAALISFFILNSSQFLPHIGKFGFIVSNLLLCLSCISGTFGKLYAVICRIHLEILKNLEPPFQKILDKYFEESDEISKYAEDIKTDVNTELNFNDIVDEFISNFPFSGWLKKIIQKKSTQKQPLILFTFSIKYVFSFRLCSFLVH